MRQLFLPEDHIILVDDEDYDGLVKYHWSQSGGYRYAIRKEKGVSIFMQNQIMNHIVNKITQVDHRNFNGLDNQKCNLEVVTTLVNQRRAKARQTGVRVDPLGNILPSNIHYIQSRKKWIVKYNAKYRGIYDSFNLALIVLDDYKKLERL